MEDEKLRCGVRLPSLAFAAERVFAELLAEQLAEWGVEVAGGRSQDLVDGLADADALIDLPGAEVLGEKPRLDVVTERFLKNI